VGAQPTFFLDRSHLSAPTCLSRVLATVLVCLCGGSSVSGAGLNDTGQSLCYAAGRVASPHSATVGGDNGVKPRQDGRFGRDPSFAASQLSKAGAGSAAFDYSKISNSGMVVPLATALGTAPGAWACTRDNVTGLIWEVKTTSGLRSGHTYTWYSTDNAANGGPAGVGNIGQNTCGGTLSAYGDKCNTQNYVAAVNSAGLCGATDWRLPARYELLKLVHAGEASPSIDRDYFPNTTSSAYWTRNTSAESPAFAWSVSFDGASLGGPGSTSTSGKTMTTTYVVRLVRTGP
jgi:hypothetical protein